MSDRTCIMLVEDTASHRKLYASWLRIGGYDPHVLTDERVAQQVAEQVKPAAIIVDIRLRTVSGLEVIEGLKAASGTCAIPVMALTVLDSASDRSACLAAGADVFVTKPDHIAVFLDRIAALLV